MNATMYVTHEGLVTNDLFFIPRTENYVPEPKPQRAHWTPVPSTPNSARTDLGAMRSCWEMDMSVADTMSACYAAGFVVTQNEVFTNFVRWDQFA